MHANFDTESAQMVSLVERPYAAEALVKAKPFELIQLTLLTKHNTPSPIMSSAGTIEIVVCTSSAICSRSYFYLVGPSRVHYTLFFARRANCLGIIVAQAAGQFRINPGSQP